MRQLASVPGALPGLFIGIISACGSSPNAAVSSDWGRRASAVFVTLQVSSSQTALGNVDLDLPDHTQQELSLQLEWLDV